MAESGMIDSVAGAFELSDSKQPHRPNVVLFTVKILSSKALGDMESAFGSEGGPGYDDSRDWL